VLNSSLKKKNEEQIGEALQSSVPFEIEQHSSISSQVLY
jgi:hypothetical protein